jgi:hypothetical protein
MQEVQHEQQLGHLTPKRAFIAVQALERAAVEIGKPQKAAGHGGIFIASAIDGGFKLGLSGVTRLDFRAIGTVRLSRHQPGEGMH